MIVEWFMSLLSPLWSALDALPDADPLPIPSDLLSNAEIIGWWVPFFPLMQFLAVMLVAFGGFFLFRLIVWIYNLVPVAR